MIKPKCGIVVTFHMFRDYVVAKKLAEQSNLKIEPDGIDTIFFENIENDFNKLRFNIDAILNGIAYTIKNVR